MSDAGASRPRVPKRFDEGGTDNPIIFITGHRNIPMTVPAIYESELQLPDQSPVAIRICLTLFARPLKGMEQSAKRAGASPFCGSNFPR